MNSRLLRIMVPVVLAFVGMAYAGNDKDQAAPAASGVNAGTPQQQTGTPQLQQRNPRYRLQNGDVLVLDFPFTPEFNETATVQPDGFLSVRGLGDIHIAGMTLPEAQAALKTAYSAILKDPVVTITPQSFVAPYFIAYGEVGKPGKYDLHGETTLAQAIGVAGGFTKDAKHSDVYLFRRVSDEWVSSQKINVKEMLKSGNLSEDQELHPGDMIWVPKSTISKLLMIQPLIPYNTFRVNFIP